MIKTTFVLTQIVLTAILLLNCAAEYTAREVRREAAVRTTSEEAMTEYMNQISVERLSPLLAAAKKVQKTEHRTASTSTNQDSTEPIEFVGQMGGSVYAVMVQDNYAYLGVGPRLVILDVSEPANPIIAGQTTTLPDVVTGVYVAGNYAYAVVRHDGGLRVIDVSDPAMPREVGTYTNLTSPRAVYVAGNYAYVVAESNPGLQIFDISDPTMPREVGVYAAPLTPQDIFVVGDYAYVANGNGGLRIFSISDPATPNLVGTYTPAIFSSFVTGVFTVENYAYVTDLNGGLRVVSISDPVAPVEIGSLTSLNHPRGVYVTGNYAYIADKDAGLKVIDVSSPSSPAEVGSYEKLGLASDVFITNNYAYVVAPDVGFWIVDISTPTTPLHVGAYLTGAASDVYLIGDYAYIAAGHAGLLVIDKSNPTMPVQVGSYPMPGRAQNVYIAGTYAYVTVGQAGLHILDVSDPTRPIEVGTYQDPAIEIEKVYVIRDYAYMTTRRAGVRIVNVSDPATPTEVSAIPGFVADIHIANDYAYLLDSGDLRIIDISDPSTPVEVSTYNVSTFAWGIYVVGNYAYVISGLSGLHIIDVSDPTHPVGVSTYQIQNGTSVSVAGAYAFIVRNAGCDLFACYGGLTVIDISDPGVPLEVGTYDLLGQAGTVQVEDDDVYLATGENGLVVLKLVTSVSIAISNTGGTLISPIDRTTYTFAPGTFSTTVTITHTYLHANDVPSIDRLIGIRHFFEISARYSDTGQPAQPLQPYRITVQYTNAEKGATDEDKLALYIWNGTQWTREPSSIVDIDTNTVTATPARFGLWAVLANPNLIPPPGKNIRLISQFGGPVYSGTIQDHYAYLGVGPRLIVLDISDPTNLVEIGRTQVLPGFVSRVIVANNYAYAISPNFGLQIIDVSNPSHPVEIGALSDESAGEIRGFDVVGHYAYLTNRYPGLKVIDVSDPTAPAVVGTYDLQFPGDIQVVGDYAYIAASWRVY